MPLDAEDVMGVLSPVEGVHVDMYVILFGVIVEIFDAIYNDPPYCVALQLLNERDGLNVIVVFVSELMEG